jgi:hypothetical protein
MRISLLDCDVPMPTPADCNRLLMNIPTGIGDKYLPEDTETLSRLWVDLLNLTVALSNILSANYRAEPKLPDKTEIENFDTRIRACFKHRDPSAVNSSPVVDLHSYHVDLYTE